MQSRIDDLLDLYRKAGSIRNEFAHGTVRGDVRTKDPYTTTWFLVPPFSSTRKNTVTLYGSYKYDSKMINEFAEKFDWLCGVAHMIIRDLVAHYEAQPQERRAQY